jgi:REP element-mobilizing transposase RayT
MPRNVRIEYPGAFYHVMARGNRREAIFSDDLDRRFFLKTLGEACEMTGWRVHAYVLMGNHYHLMIETPEANLIAGMKWLQNAYTRRYNTRHRLWGRLFGDRYKSVVVEAKGTDYYYCTLMDYIHLNPVRAGLIRPKEGQTVLDYPWCSVAVGYGVPAKRRPIWLAVDAGLAAFDLRDDPGGRRRFVERIDRRANEEAKKGCGVPESPEDGRMSHLRRGWYWGTQAFGEKLLKLAEQLIGSTRNPTYRSGPIQRAHGEKQAEAMVMAGLEESGLPEGELERLPGNDPRKVKIAGEVWERTTVSMGWIAERLAMKSAANVSQILRRERLLRGEAKQGKRRCVTNL